MEPPALLPLLLLPRHFRLHLLLLLLPLLNAAASTPPRCLDSERSALLQFKAGLRDPEGRLSSWRGRDCCRWSGVACDNVTGAVVKLDLRNPFPRGAPRFPEGFGNLSGRVDPSLLRLRSLAFLDLNGNWFNGGAIPAWLGSLTQLRHLDLSDAGFAGAVPPQLGHLSSLRYLYLSSSSQSRSPLRVEGALRWLSGLSSLRFLSMDGVDLSRADSVELFRLLNRELPSVVELHLSGCGLSGIPHSLPTPVNFTNLTVVDLSGNTFVSGAIPAWLLNVTSLVSLTMVDCGLHSAIPPGLSELPNIETLILESNSLKGGLPSSIGKLCNLRMLYLHYNNLTGELPQTLDHPDACSSGGGPLPSLVELELSYNRISGNLPGWLGQLKNIKYLAMDSNMFSGPLPLDLGKLSELVVFSASDNQLSDSLSEVHLTCLRHLDSFYISGNPALTLHLSSDWTPPFQVKGLYMGRCKLGPKFPSWIKNQRRLQWLDLSRAGISDAIPAWFWGMSSELQELNLSSNSITGFVPESIAAMKGLTSLDLSNNRFSGSIPSSLASMARLSFLDLSNNNLSGEVPNGGRLKAFNMSAFHGNPYLCGPPTDAHCAGDSKVQIGQIGAGRGHCSCDTTAMIVHLLLGICALGIAVLLLHVFIKKRHGFFRKRDTAGDKAAPTGSAEQPEKVLE